MKPVEKKRQPKDVPVKPKPSNQKTLEGLLKKPGNHKQDQSKSNASELGKYSMIFDKNHKYYAQICIPVEVQPWWCECTLVQQHLQV